MAMLNGFIVAILIANGFQQNEMTSPRNALLEAGATVEIVSTEDTMVEGWDWYTSKACDNFLVDVHIDRADAEKYHALLIPGGLSGPDDLRLNQKAISFVKQFANKPIAAICHGPWLLIDAHLVRGKTITSWPSIKQDLLNAGATWVDQEVVVDQKLVTSRSPEDLSSFNKEMLRIFTDAHNSQNNK